MGLTTAVRIGAGLLTFSVLARTLGPAAFGTFMLWLSVGAFAALGAGFGLVSYVLRESGVRPSSFATVYGRSITAVAILAVAALISAALIGAIFRLEHPELMLLLMAALLVDALSELISAGLRAHSRFDLETKSATVSAVIHVTIMCCVVIFSRDIVCLAIAFFFSRCTVLAIAFTVVTRAIGIPIISSVAEALRTMKHASSYALDSVLQGTFGNIDSLIINFFLGTTAVGIYQAGMRLFQSCSQAASILSNVFLPRAASWSTSSITRRGEAISLQLTFLGVGVAIGLLFAVGAESIVTILFGGRFDSLTNLLPAFGLLFFLRFAAAAWGVLLTAAGEQAYRAFCSFVYWLVTLAMAAVLVPVWGIAGWLASLCCATVLLILAYAGRASRHLQSVLPVLGYSAAGASIFLPYVWK